MKKINFLLFLTIFYTVAAFSVYAGEVLESDINNDGEIDGWTYLLDSGKLDKQEIDMNFDGEVDSVYIYEPDGKIREEILDTDFDGRMDNWRMYEKGDLVLDKVDSDYNGTVDVWYHVDRSRIYRIERDTTGDGQPDKTIEYNL